MKILENRAISIIIMVVLIIGGLLLGGYKSIGGLYSNVEDVFFLGEDKDGICVANDLSERVSAATNMTTIAYKYKEQLGTDGLQLIDNLTSAGANVNDAIFNRKTGDIQKALSANKDLDTAMEALYRAMGEVALSSQDEKYRQSLFADFNSRNDTISHDPYNSYAKEYMQLLKGFPASLIASIMPVKEVAVSY